MWNRLKISQDDRRNSPHGSEGSLSDETSDRIDADCASVMSFNMHDFDQETASRFAKHASVRANHHHVAEKQYSNYCRRSFTSSAKFIRAHWAAALITSVIFLVLIIGTVTLGAFQLDRTQAKVREDALGNARDIIHYFSEQFENAMLPLLTLEQLIHEIPEFAELTTHIGAPNEVGSLPYERFLFRNLTDSLCLKPDVTTRYDEAVQRILGSFSVLHDHVTTSHGYTEVSNPFISIALAPHGVICLNHQVDPKLGDHIAKVIGRAVNTTDFMGFDIIAPYYASEFFDDFMNGSSPIRLAGPTPIPCRQGDISGYQGDEYDHNEDVLSGSCNGGGKTFSIFEAQLAVKMNGTTLKFLKDDGSTVVFPYWGLILASIHWDAMVEASTIFELFEENELEFKMTRLDENGQDTLVLVESTLYQEHRGKDEFLREDLFCESSLTNESWKISVVYKNARKAQQWIFPLLILISLCVSAFIFKIYLQKQEHLTIKGVALAQESKVETERNMTAYFAHELRNPLSAMDSALKAIADDELNESTKELITGMRICSSFMASIMNNLLDVRKMEEGKLALKRMPVDMDHLVKDLHRMFVPNVRTHVKFVWRSDFTSSDQRWVFGDNHRLQQVFTNIITNALKYTTEGSVTLSIGWEDDYPRSSTEHVDSERLESMMSSIGGDTLDMSALGASYHVSGIDPPGAVVRDDKSGMDVEDGVDDRHDSFRSHGAPTASLGSLRGSSMGMVTKANKGGASRPTHGTLHAGPQRLRFECADTGPGIMKSHQDQLFKKFVQRGGAPGTGLGLAISKHLVELMKGEIYFDSDPTIKPGSSCIVLLPLERCDSPYKDDETLPVGGGTESGLSEELIEEPLSILIVDDIKMNRTMLKRRFEKGVAPHCQITEAPNGETAVEICEHETFDVIIMDQFMEDAGGLLTGTDTILALRRHGVQSLIIGCSGNDLDNDFLEAGANRCWQKPLPTNAMIIRQFRRHLQQTHATKSH